MHSGSLVKGLLVVVVRETALTAKVMVLVLWHAIRYPAQASVVDPELGTVRLLDDDN
ncbi:MAG: hypothetical protein AB1778_06415 [Candidatus Bipolaricaulota bacterium]